MRLWRTVIVSCGVAIVLLAGGGRVMAARIVGEWTPGLTGSELGGQLVVDGYGVSGLGAYEVRLDDGTTVLAVCIQADVGHSLAAEYVVEPPATLGAELDYLLWRYLSPGAPPPTDEQAAALNLLAWADTGAQRSTGGPVWVGDDIEVRVLGVGRLDAVEATVAALRAEAVARRGPWNLSDVIVVAGEASVVLRGPGGPIEGQPITFTSADGATVTAMTGADGRAAAPLDGATNTVVVHVRAPGSAATLAASGWQRLAIAGPPVDLGATLALPPTTPPPTTTVPPTTTSSSTTTTGPPTTTTSPPTTTTSSTTTSSSTTTTSPPTSASTVPPVPPTLPATGASMRPLTRVGAWSFAVGALSVLLATPRVRRGRRAT